MPQKAVQRHLRFDCVGRMRQKASEHRFRLCRIAILVEQPAGLELQVRPALGDSQLPGLPGMTGGGGTMSFEAHGGGHHQQRFR